MNPSSLFNKLQNLTNSKTPQTLYFLPLSRFWIFFSFNFWFQNLHWFLQKIPNRNGSWEKRRDSSSKRSFLLSSFARHFHRNLQTSCWFWRFRSNGDDEERTRGVLLRIRAQQTSRTVFCDCDCQNRCIHAWTHFYAGGDANTTRRVGHETVDGFRLPGGFVLLLGVSPMVRRRMSLSSPESLLCFRFGTASYSEIHRRWL